MVARERRIVRVFFVLVSLAYFGVYPYLQAINNPNENTRSYLVMALVDYGTFRLDPVVWRFGWTNDMASVPDPLAPGGVHVAAVKGPAMSYLGVPVYLAEKLVLRLFGRHPPGAESKPEQAASWLRITTLTLELFTAHLPCFAFLVWFERRLRRVSHDVVLRLSTIAAVGLGSNYLAYSLVFVSHAPSAALCFVSLEILAAERLRARGDPARARERSALVAGLCIGGLTLLEYQNLFLSLVLGGFALTLFRTKKTFGPLALGVAVNVALLGLFQWASFGNAFTPGHRMMQTDAFRALQSQGLFGITLPHADALRGLLFDGGYGLFPTTPFFALALLSPLLLFRKTTSRAGRERRSMTAVALLLTLTMVLTISSAVIWRGGWTIGPRYLCVLAPLLGYLALTALDRWARRGLLPRTFARAVSCGLALASFAVGGAIGLLVSTLPESIHRPIPQILLPFLRAELVPHHLLELVGVGSAWPAFLTLLAAGLAAASLLFLPAGDRPRELFGRIVLASCIAAVCVLPALSMPQNETDAGREVRAMFYGKWEPKGRDLPARAHQRGFFP